MRESRGAKRHLIAPLARSSSLLFRIVAFKFSRCAEQTERLKEATTVKNIKSFFTNFFLTSVTPSQASPTENSSLSHLHRFLRL